MTSANSTEDSSKQEVVVLEKIGDVEFLPDPPPRPPVTEEQYPDALHLAFATLALIVAVLLVALDTHILGTLNAEILKKQRLTLSKQLRPQRSRPSSTVS